MQAHLFRPNCIYLVFLLGFMVLLAPKTQGQDSPMALYRTLTKQDSIALSHGDTIKSIEHKANLGELFFKQEMYNEALSYFFDALALSNQTQQQHNQKLLYNNIGFSYNQQNKPDSALKWLRKACLNNTDDIASLLNLAYQYKTIGEKKAADSLFNQLLSTIDRQTNPSVWLSVYLTHLEGNLKQQNRQKLDTALNTLKALSKQPNTQTIRNIVSAKRLSDIAEANKAKNISVKALQLLKNKFLTDSMPLDLVYKANKLYYARVPLTNNQKATLAIALESLSDSLIKTQQKQKLLDLRQKHKLMNLMTAIKAREQKLIYTQNLLKEKQTVLRLQLGVLAALIVLGLSVALHINQTNRRRKLSKIKLELENKILNEQFKNNQREIQNQSLLLLQKRTLVEKAISLFKSIDTAGNTRLKIEIERSIDKMEKSLIEENATVLAKEALDESSKLQIEQLKTDYDQLTENDLRLASVLMMHLNTDQTAELLGINKASLNKARYRLRKKLTLQANDDLIGFLTKYKTENKQGTPPLTTLDGKPKN